MSTPNGARLGTGGNVSNTPKATYMSTLSSTPTNTPPSPTLPKVSGSSGGNASATTPKSTFVNSQIDPNTSIPAGANTPGYSYENGRLATVGGKPIGTPSSSPSTTSMENVNKNYYSPSGGVSSGTSATPTSSAATDYQSAFQTYLASLQPSSEETNLGKDLAGLRLQAQKDQDYALERPGQTNAFATGETARVNRNNAYQIDAETNALNAITSARTGRSDASKAMLDYTKSLMPSNDPYTLSAGQTRYGADGTPIASVPSAPGAPKIIGDSSTGYYTVGEDGKLSKLLGAAPKALNDTQSKQQAYSTINQLLGMTDENGVPYTDPNGYFTPEGFKKIVSNAIEDGLNRGDILQQYGDKLFPGAIKKYGLTPKEIADLGLE